MTSKRATRRTKEEKQAMDDRLWTLPMDLLRQIAIGTMTVEQAEQEAATRHDTATDGRAG